MRELLLSHLFVGYLPSYIQLDIVANTGECRTIFLEIDLGLSRSNTPKCGDNLFNFLFMS